MNVVYKPATAAQLAAADQADRERRDAAFATATRLRRAAETERHAANAAKLAASTLAAAALANPTPVWLQASRAAEQAADLADEAATVAEERAHDANLTAAGWAARVRRNEDAARRRV